MYFKNRLTYLCALGSVLAVTACGSSGSPPSITSIQLTVSLHCVLAYKLEVKTDVKTMLSVTVTPKNTSEQPWTVTSAQASTDNTVAIAGMRAQEQYDLEITASDNTGSATDTKHSITTDALPSDLPPIDVKTADSAKMSPGFTYFGVIRWLASNGQPAAQGWLIMLDNAGKIVWYYQTPSYPGGGWGGGPQDVRLLPDGNVGYGHEGSIDGFTEVDPLGNTVKSWVATGTGKTAPAGTVPVSIDSMHHAAYPLPNGDFLTLTSELKNPGSQNCASTTQNFVGDDAVEFKPDGTVVKKVSEFDILDPCRQRTMAQLQLDYATGYWNEYYGGITTQDWTHSNAVVYDQPRGLAIVSVRHQDLIIGLDWQPGDPTASGKVAWIFGDQENPGDFSNYPHFTKTGTETDGEFWTFHQHGVVVFDNGDLGAFDNGNLRPGTDFTGGTLPYSRVVEFSLDTKAMTAKQVWQYKAPDPYRPGGVMYCPFFGIVQKLPNGDMLADFGGGVEPPSDAITDPSERKFARVVELQPSDNTVVFDMIVTDPAAKNFTGYSVYRARRITGFLRQPSAPHVDGGP